MDAAPQPEQVRALEQARAVVEHEDMTLTSVAGADAREWLHDLVTADVASLEPGRSGPCLLLTPTGRIRAAFQVLCLGERAFLLAQREDQPRPVADLLAPYVLSSDVTIEVRSGIRLLSLPGAGTGPAWAGRAWRPSILGPGVDLLVAEGDRAVARRRLEEAGLVRAGAEAVEAWRIGLGVPRFPVDLDEDSLPAEAVLPSEAIDLSKGCFLGQEALARVRNLGHPTRVVLAVAGEGPVAAGDPVWADGRQVGLVTSASGPAALVRVRWNAREALLVAGRGTPLRRR